MNRVRTEIRVLDIVNHVVGGGKVEDDYVEAKAEWPQDPLRAARRIAGMANSAGGEPIIWIIGLDEKAHQVLPQDSTDAADWWAAVETRFADDTTPDLSVLNVPTDHGRVVCLHFVTDRAPYLVKTDSSGGITREVPWRSGTRVRTANRRELLSLLKASVAVPKLELIDPIIEFRHDRRTGRPGTVTVLEINAVLFIDSDPGVHVYLPRHKWSVEFNTDLGPKTLAERVKIYQPGEPIVAASNAYGVAERPGGITALGPDAVELRAWVAFSEQNGPAAIMLPSGKTILADWVEVDVQLPTNDTTRIARIRQRLHRISTRAKDEDAAIIARWLPRASSDAEY